MNKKTSAWAAIGLFSAFGVGGILYNNRSIYGHIQNSFLGKIVDPNEAKTTSDKKQEPQNRNLEFKLAEFLRNRDKLPISLRVPDFTGNYFSIVSKGRDQQSNVIVKPKEKNFYANKLVDALDLNFNKGDISGVESLISNLPQVITGLKYFEKHIDDDYGGEFMLDNDETRVKFILDNKYEAQPDNLGSSKSNKNTLIIEILNPKEVKFQKELSDYKIEIGYESDKISLFLAKIGSGKGSSAEFIIRGENSGPYGSNIMNYIPMYLLLKQTRELLSEMNIPIVKQPQITAENRTGLSMRLVDLIFQKMRTTIVTP